MSVEVIIDEDRFEMLQLSRNIIGGIYFKVEDEFFPQKEWSDFAVVILAWWIESIIRGSKSKINSSCELLFMDGPYSVRGTKINNDILEMEFIERDEVVLGQPPASNNC